MHSHAPNAMIQDQDHHDVKTQNGQFLWFAVFNVVAWLAVVITTTSSH